MSSLAASDLMVNSDVPAEIDVSNQATLTEPTPGLLAAAFYDCTRLTRQTAGNFYYSFLVLPPIPRRAMCALYAFMRQTDDIADQDGDPELKRAALQEWRSTLRSVLAGDKPTSRWWWAFRQITHDYHLPAQLYEDVIDGVACDTTPVRYQHFAELYSYCYRVASAVGLLCIRLWGCRSPQADIYAEWTGIAFQLTNILRDLAEDRREGRVYVPADELQRFGLNDVPTEGPASHEFLSFMEFQIDRARDYYRRAEPLVEYLPGPGRAVLGAMTKLYRGLLEEIAADPSRVLRERVSLSKPRKLWTVLRYYPVRWWPVKPLLTRPIPADNLL